ncbi:MAG: hypothetical protein PF482_07145 [Desulfobacteraceae bacterium]|nr:hypothetical protein [Desulfobacteraceae bacterium]
MKKEELLSKFGFSFSKGGAHSSRTIMLEDLDLLFDAVADPAASKDEYFSSIINDNCLKKRSVRTRQLTARHLADLYALDPSIALFRVLRFFWQRDKGGRPLIALLCAYARDSILSSSTPFILNFSEGNIIRREALEEFIDDKESDRFSKATLKSVAQNINSSFTKSGHLTGKVKKIRTKAIPTPGAAAYALLLGYLSGLRGESLFNSEYTRLLDCPSHRTIELAEIASQKGWIVFKRIGNVMELLFPSLLTTQEMDWIREQN